MALTTDQQRTVDDLKKKAPNPLPTAYTDEQLWDSVNATSVNVALASLWDEQASKTASYFDVREGSSSRNLGDIHDNAVKRAAYFRSAAGTDAPGGLSTRPRTRAIVRPS